MSWCSRWEWAANCLPQSVEPLRSPILAKIKTSNTGHLLKVVNWGRRSHSVRRIGLEMAGRKYGKMALGPSLGVTGTGRNLHPAK